MKKPKFNRKRFNILFITLLFLSLPVTGNFEPKILERLGLIVAVGYDKMPKNKIRATSVLHQVDPQSKNSVIVLSSEALTSKGSRNSSNRKSHKRLVSGQLRVAIYNIDLAKDGIFPLVDTLYRDSSIANTVYLAVSKTDTKELLSHEYPEIGNIGTFIVDNIRQNIIREQMVSSTLHEFLESYYSLEDPMMPLLDRKDNVVELKDVALFRDGQMVGTINPTETFLMKLIRDRYSAGSVEISIEMERMKRKLPQLKNINEKYLRMVIDNIKNNTNIRLMSRKPLKFGITVKIDGILKETSEEMSLGDPKVIRVLEEEVSRYLRLRSERLMTKLTDLNSDPIGLGEVYRAKIYRSGLTNKKWRQMYPEAEFDIKVKTTIVRTGEID
ncbi:hypothetical protein SY83_14500 [Paenibacillus swuensis]|uniref:Uncharacterized protein n=1 Tax=Paenibacillus swuensis TaxID=1178515 RepID=A0A172TJX9_9BACL|nr:Ger(x)C family spore germination protein [Paenibacillus swuensis]ANE47276.1 hypothetical protein SY83_14500 [Paenibacillus swuensis]